MCNTSWDMNYFPPFWSSPVDRQKAMHMSPSCKLHRWAQKGYQNGAPGAPLLQMVPFFSECLVASVRPSVRPSVCPSVRPSVGHRSKIFVCVCNLGAFADNFMDAVDRLLIWNTIIKNWLLFTIHVFWVSQAEKVVGIGEKGLMKFFFTFVIVPWVMTMVRVTENHSPKQTKPTCSKWCRDV